MKEETLQKLEKWKKALRYGHLIIRLDFNNEVEGEEVSIIDLEGERGS